MSWQHLNQPQGWIGVISLSLSLLWLPVMHAWCAAPRWNDIRFQCLWTMPAAFSLAMRACLAVSVSPGPSELLPRLAPRVALAVRADARDVIYLSTCLFVLSLHLISPTHLGQMCNSSSYPALPLLVGVIVSMRVFAGQWCDMRVLHAPVI